MSLGTAITTGVLSAIYQIVFNSIAVKIIVLGGIFVVLTLVFPFLVELLPDFMDASQITSLFNQLPSEIYWFFNLFRLDFGFPLVMSALIARFLIRRLPLIG